MYIYLRSKFVNDFLANLARQTYFKRLANVAESRHRKVHTVGHKDKPIMTDSSNNYDDVIVLKKDTRFMRRKQKRLETHSFLTESNTLKELDIKPLGKIRKNALLLGYCGANYFGMQRQMNYDIPTIELELFKALLQSEYISKKAFANPDMVKFQRASRTDTGVSAARNVVTLNLCLDATKEGINSKLPPTIRVFSIKRVSKSFDSYKETNARTYSYTLPTYVFEPDVTYASMTDKKAYRISAEKYTKVNEVLQVYKGTKKYHNFTRNKLFDEKSSSRTYYWFCINRVFNVADMEFAELQVKGQSFMLHQIRKMVGLMIAIVRGCTDYSMMMRAFTEEEIKIPKAPGLGLMLEQVHYEKYNQMCKNKNRLLEWDENEEEVQRFKEEYIYPNIVKSEIEDGSIGIWSRVKLKGHCYKSVPDSVGK